MFKNSSKILFLFLLIMSTMLIISSNSWFSAWMGLEINLLSFIPLMSDNNLMSTEASLKYFLTQALASSVLMFSIVLMMIYQNFEIFNYLWFFNKMNIFNMMIFSSLLLKLGGAPLHFWFPNIIEGLSWMNTLILMTWQKIAPFMLMTNMMSNIMIIMCSMLSIFFGAIGGISQTLLRKLMAFSSINHIGWMMSSLLYNNTIWMIYLLFYSYLSFNLIFMFNMWKIFHLNKMFTTFNFSKNLKFIVMFNLLSLSGLPPFLGFIPKWLVINLLTINNQFLLTLLMISLTMLTIFFYLRICYSGFMLNHQEPKWLKNFQLNFNQMNYFLIFSKISILGLPLISLIYFML
uniref:NADH dehydrogenase subunit 2 n=1 Tax=Pachylophus rufescens TaxID=3127035 RepID=UPI0030FE693A